MSLSPLASVAQAFTGESNPVAAIAADTELDSTITHHRLSTDATMRTVTFSGNGSPLWVKNLNTIGGAPISILGTQVPAGHVAHIAWDADAGAHYVIQV